MSEKRFRPNFDVSIYDSEKEEYISVSGRGLEEIAKRMNEQQATICKLQDLCGESDGENAKLRIENKKLKEENEKLEQQYHNLGNAIVKTCNDLGKEDIYLGDFDICKRITEYEKELNGDGV